MKGTKIAFIYTCFLLFQINYRDVYEVGLLTTQIPRLFIMYISWEKL